MNSLTLLRTLSAKKSLRRLKTTISSRGKADSSNEIAKRKETAADAKLEYETRLAKYQIPDEDPEVPKKHVFQQIRRVKLTGGVYTLEEAAQCTENDLFHSARKYPAASEQTGTLQYANRSYKNEHTTVFQFPDVTDFLIVGSGLIGSATAYYTKLMASRCADVVVIDKAPYSPNNCTATCNGLLSCQSKSRDVSRIAQLSKELIRNLRRDIVVSAEDIAQIKYRPVTHLVLWPEHEVEEVIQSVDEQIRDGCYTEARLPEELEQKWPWLKVKESDVKLGTYGNQDEALVDPIGLRNVYRTLAQAHGVHFIQAEALDFNTRYTRLMNEIDPLAANAMIARISTGEIQSVSFAKTLLSLGHNMPFLEAQSEMAIDMRDSIMDLHFIQPKLRLCFLFTSEAAPIINFPVITNTDGSVLLRDDYAGTFKYYLTLEECEKFFEDDTELFMDLESDEPFVNLFHRGKLFKDYFNNVIKPKLVKLIPIMDDSQFVMANSGFESVNSVDSNPVLGLHPFHSTVVLSGGYGKRLIDFAPSAAASLSELLLLDQEETFDLTNFYWNRVINGRKIKEFHSLVA